MREALPCRRGPPGQDEEARPLPDARRERARGGRGQRAIRVEDDHVGRLRREEARPRLRGGDDGRLDPLGMERAPRGEGIPCVRQDEDEGRRRDAHEGTAKGHGRRGRPRGAHEDRHLVEARGERNAVERRLAGAGTRVPYEASLALGAVHDEARRERRRGA